MALDWVMIAFVFVFGAAIGSFLNVVVWRLPRGESLLSPPSHCPKCQTPLEWYDNVPIVGWLKLAGKCRHCREPISVRYPLVEASTGLIFAGYYVLFFILQIGPCAPAPVTIQTSLGFILRPTLAIETDWAIYGLYMLTLAGLLAASLIDAELFIIPIEIPWFLAALGMVVHAGVDHPALAGALNVGPVVGAMSAGGTVGLTIAVLLWKIGWIPTSFPRGEPILEIDRAVLQSEIDAAKKSGQAPPPLPPEYSPRAIRREIGKEMFFLLPPLLGALAGALAVLLPGKVPAFWRNWCEFHWFTGMLGSLLGALVGAFVVWITRILGTLAFGRVAMGLGDAHLMFGVGAVIGAGAATVAFFLAPFFGLLLAIWMLATGKRRELPYGPYLSLATGFVMIYHCPIAAYLRPGLSALVEMLSPFR